MSSVALHRVVTHVLLTRPRANYSLSRLLLTVAVLGAAAPVASQNAAGAKTPVFDVVSVKQAIDTNVRRLAWTPGHFVALSMPFVGLVNMAYGDGAPVRLEGGDSIRLMMWDVEATFDPALAPTPAQRAAMLRAVLEDRFRLVLRIESRETEVYALMLARADGKLGPSFQPSTLPCTTPPRAPFSPTAPPAGQPPACGSGSFISAAQASGGALIGGDIVLEGVTRGLGSLLQRPVVDRTGLTGKFDVVLRFAWDSAVRPLPIPSGQPPAPGGPPNIFTALREQLGLKLESTRAPLDYHIVERLQMPAAN